MSRIRLITGCGMCVAGCCILAGCAGSVETFDSESILPEIDVVQVKEHADQALAVSREMKIEVNALNNKIMDIDNRIALLHEEVSDVSLAKIEELETRMSLLIEALKNLQNQISAIEVLPQVRVKPKSSKPSAPPAFSPSSAMEILSSSEYDVYRNALHVWNARRYQEAIGLFSEVLKMYPDGKYADDCHYWTGEAYYAQRDFAQAIVSFQRVLTYSNSSKADDALFKYGLCLRQLGKPGDAESIFTKLITQYPSSEYVPRAKKYLPDQ